MKKLSTLFALMLFGQMMVNAQNFGLQLDGTGGSIPLCDSDDYNVGTGFTIEAWVFASEWRAESWQGSIVTKDQNAPSGFAFRAGDNGRLSMVVGIDNDWIEVQTDPFMNINQWYHVATVVTESTMSLYINGSLINSATFSGTPTNNNQIITIGASTGFPGRGWNGVLDEIRIWNVARTAAQINDNQTTEFTGNESGLVTYLPMNEGMGTTVGNLSDGCDGSLVNLGGDAWQDGYSIPAIDLGVLSITAPDVLSIFERPVKVSVTVQNYGSEAVSSTPIEMTVNGLPKLSGTLNQTIQPGETAEYTFDDAIDLSGANTNLINVSTTHADDANGLNDDVAYRYRRPDDDNTLLQILNEEQHNFGDNGQTQFNVINMPRHMEDYEQLLLHFSVECPSTGCDPWDQPASFFLIDEEGREYELARFITPFGIECGGWTVDVTDFKSVMSGTITIKSFIQVWGPSGWLLSADLEFVKGEEQAHSRLLGLWETNYWVYGDPGIEDDLEAQTASIADHTQSSHFRMTLSGHGQGNTDNAAEFSNQVHDVMVNGMVIDNHNPWKTDCGQNECANQLGTWTLNRAGWCPGQQVIPYIVDLTNEATPGQDVSIDYQLEDYTNLLNTGYDGAGHTEPHFRIHAFLVEESDQRYVDFRNLRAEEIAYVVGEPASESYLAMRITNTGSEAIGNATVAYYVDGELVLEESINGTIAAGGEYVHEFSSTDQLTGDLDQEVFGVVNANNDEDISDDATSVYLDAVMVNVTEASVAGIDVYPNPTNGELTIDLTPEMLGGQVDVLDASGKLLISRTITSVKEQLQLNHRGVLMLRMRNLNGETYFAKVVVQ